MDTATAQQSPLASGEPYDPVSVTTDGWKPVQDAWKAQVPSITLIECNLHGRKRVDVTLSDYAKSHPELSPDQRQQIKTEFDSTLLTQPWLPFPNAFVGT